ncbi:MAG: histidine phosphatase family protein, partial [Chitinophagales bacterium]
RWEARMVSDRLKDEKIDAIYASALIRARETAEIIARPHGLPVKEVPDLNEMNFGEWEGLSADEIVATFGEEGYRTWQQSPGEAVIPNGENYAEFADRIEKGIKSIVEAHQNETVLIVTHGGAIMALGCRLNGEELSCFRRYYCNNAAISIIELEGDACHFELLNACDHLQNYESQPDPIWPGGKEDRQ